MRRFTRRFVGLWNVVPRSRNAIWITNSTMTKDKSTPKILGSREGTPLFVPTTITVEVMMVWLSKMPG